MKKAAVSRSGNWNVSLIRLNSKLFKVTRSNYLHSVNETEFFCNEEKAMEKFNVWLSQ